MANCGGALRFELGVSYGPAWRLETSVASTHLRFERMRVTQGTRKRDQFSIDRFRFLASRSSLERTECNFTAAVQTAPRRPAGRGRCCLAPVDRNAIVDRGA